ncbi:uncharacterized protein [Chelonus insularis]|uniref:uncharacterized protein n=1 Tax=Chelonus insularis TaxID=460826 RepID=UPI00158B5904|nr:uncharacterized protein LOC118070121 [Chelonus insularis]
MKFYLTIFGIILAFGLVSGVSIQRFIIQEVTVEVYPNPYVTNVNVIINGQHNDTVTIKIPIHKELPNNIILSNYIVYNGEPIPPMKGELCNLFDDKVFAPSVLEAGVPRDEFPKQCPVLPNMNYTILNYAISPEEIPPGLPDGTVITDIYVSLDGDDSNPLLTIHAESLLHTDVPDPSSLMG